MVSDDGPGFTSEELTKATRLYFHGKSTGDCHYGMGLYICDLLCKKHGGCLLWIFFFDGDKYEGSNKGYSHDGVEAMEYT